MLTDEQKKLVGEAFDDLDGARKGFIPATRENLLEAARMAGLNPTEREMTRKMEEADFKDVISRSEFCDFLCKFEWHDLDETTARLNADFSMFDSHKRGALDAFEIKNILTREGPEALPEKEVEEVIATFVKDADGMYNIDGVVTTLLSSSRS